MKFSATFFYGLLNMDSPVLADQQKLEYTNSAGTQHEVYKTY